MGCGKTVYGKPLAKILGLPFFDIDECIEKERDKSIPQIFTAEGEDMFRQYEQSALHRITAQNANFVLATGGGTPCFFYNMRFMNRRGTTIYLKCTVDELYENILLTNPNRPLLQGKRSNELRQHISQLLAMRERVYNQAKIILASDKHSAKKIAEVILNIP